MQAQLARAGRPGPQAIGIDEISIRKGHNYRIVVSDLERKRPIWFGGQDPTPPTCSIITSIMALAWGWHCHVGAYEAFLASDRVC